MAEIDLDHVAVLRLQPGDAVVFRVPADTAAEAVEHCRDRAERWLALAGHPDVPVLITTDAVALTVLRPEEMAKR